MNEEIQKRFDVACEAARQTGKLLLEYLQKPRQISYKGEIDLVTDADKAAETNILRMVKEHFPEDGMLAEESAAVLSKTDYRWIIDPLDGTTNFAHTFPMFCTSIAVEYRQEIVAGAVFDPIHNELFCARKGAGANLNGVRIRVSGADDLQKSLLATGFPYDRRVSPDYYIEFFKQFMFNCQAIRRCGSAALDLCYLASGRLDGFWELKLHPWDTAAGYLILAEAGGRATNFAGEPFSIFMEEVVGSNSIIHDQMLAIIAGVTSRYKPQEHQ
ncbi:MAG: inositol monophosphatase [Candidatus Omnitrophica bacterium]|nr:inositol monophosphatase [Candidatus Omnitrophota bacterium]